MRRRWILVGAAVLTLALGLSVSLADVASAKPSLGARADAVVLTVVGKDGTQKTFTLAELRAIVTPEQGFFEGYAGFVNSANNLTPVHPVKGVKLTALLSQVGYDSTTDVVVSAIDSYAKLLAPQFLQGQGILTYTDLKPYPQTPLPAGVSLTAVIVYDFKQPGQTVGDPNPWLPELAPPMGDGPLRLWFAYPDPLTPGYVVDGDWIVKWVTRIKVTGSLVQQWTVKVKGPKKTYRMRRNDFESCYNCHHASVKLSGHRYQGVPLYYLAGKVDDNKDNNNFGDFSVRLARKGYWMDFRNGTRKISISSKRIASRTRGIILAWKRDGKELKGKYAPLWLIGGKLASAQRIYGVKSVTLRFAHNRR